MFANAVIKITSMRNDTYEFYPEPIDLNSEIPELDSGDELMSYINVSENRDIIRTWPENQSPLPQKDQMAPSGLARYSEKQMSKNNRPNLLIAKSKSL